jgi:hypothetical protein
MVTDVSEEYAASIFRVPGILSSRKMCIIYNGKYKGENWSSKPIKWRFCPAGETTGKTCGDFKPLNAKLNPICWHYEEVTIFSTLAG